MRGPCAGQDPQPTKGVDPFKRSPPVRRDRLTADTMKPVAARDICAVQTFVGTVVREGDIRCRTVRVVDHDIRHLMQNVRAHRVLRGIEVGGHLGLAIDHHRLARQLFEVDAHHQVVICQVAPRVRRAFGVHAVRDTGGAQHVHCPGFQHAGPDARQYVKPCRAFQNHGRHTSFVQQLRQEQPRRPATDNGHFGLHAVSPSKRSAFSLRISGRTSSLNGAASKSANQRSGVIAGQSEPNSIFFFNSELA